MSCEQEQQVQQIKSRIGKKYSYISEEEIEECFNLALKDYVVYRYPSANNRPKYESVNLDFYCSQWLFDRMIDIIERAGGKSLTSYKENGLSLNYGSSFIDQELRLQITPKVSVPK